MKIIDYSKTILKNLGFKRKPKFILTDINNLYDNTLYYSKEIRPWSYENGIYHGLKLRYDFVKEYLSNPIDFKIEDTEYYRFIDESSNSDFKGLYEGCTEWAYSNPANLCNRFQAMVNSIIKNIGFYNILNANNYRQIFSDMYGDIIDFEKNNLIEIKYIDSLQTSIRKESNQYLSDKKSLNETMNKRFVGHLIPTGIFIGNKLVIKNGCHRLAIFKVLKEKKIFQNNFALFIEGEIK